MIEIIEDPSYSQILTVARNMREWDRREIFSMGVVRTPEDLSEHCLRSFYKGVLRTDHPVAAFGFSGNWDGYCQAWMFAAPDWAAGALALTKYARRSILPWLFFEAGIRRIEARSMVGHVQAQKWMRILGATELCKLRDYGLNGEDYLLFELCRSDFENLK